MQLFQSIAVLTLAYAAAALPTFERRAEKTNFYLFATPTMSANPTNTSPIDLYDPYYQANFLVRVEVGDPSYLQFNLTKGILSTMAMPAHIYNETLEYKSNIDVTSGSVFFSPTSGTKGLFSFKSHQGVAYLAYDGAVDGFTACDGPLGPTVINFNGTDASCVPTYVFQQTTQSF